MTSTAVVDRVGRVFRVEGFAKRIDSRPRHPAGTTVADVNGDRQPDLITAGRNATRDRRRAWLNGGAGRFVRAGTYLSGATRGPSRSWTSTAMGRWTS